MQVFKRKTDYIIAAFLIGLLFLAFSCESDAAEVAVEGAHDSNAGMTSFNNGYDRICGRVIADTGFSFLACPLVAVGGDTRTGFEIGIADELVDRWEAELRLTLFDDKTYGGIGARRVVGDGPFQMYIGGSYWVTESPGSNSNFTFNLGMRYTF